MAQRFQVVETHQATVAGVGPLQLIGGAVIDDAAYSIADLVAAGFVLVPELGGGAGALVLTPTGWTASGGGAVPPTRQVLTTAPLTGGGDLSADRTIALLYDASLALAAGQLQRAALTGDVTAPAGSNVTTIAAHAVTSAKFRQSVATSVLGVAGAALADVADIVAGADGDVLRRAGGVLGFGAIPVASVTGAVASTRAVNTTAPITGGGDLSADRTIALAYDSTLVLAAGILGREAISGDVAIVAGSNTSAIGANKVLDTMLRTGAATSVIGRSANSVGNVADIAAGADGDILRRAAGALGFGAVPVASVTGAVATTRTINTTAPLTGGGDLSADRTFAITTGVANSTDVLTRGDGDGRYPLIAVVTPAIMRPPWATYVNSTSVISIGSTTCPAWYVGRSPKALTTVDVRVKPTVVISGVTWCEMGLAKGSAPAAGANPTLTVVGYYSTGVSGAPFNSTNVASVTIPVSGGQTFDAGDHLWIVFAKLSTGSPSFRASAVGDELNTGVYADGGNVRPSTIQGTPTSFTIGATTTLLHVFHVYI